MTLNRTIVLKTLPSTSSSNKALVRFQNEAKMLSGLKHTGIGSLYDFGVADGLAFLALEFIDGVNLAELLNSKAPLELPQLLEIFVQLSRALEYSHSEGVVHRDLKPANIMLRSQDYASVLIDFGIAKRLTDSDEDVLRLTEPGHVIGSPLYMSPEQCQGEAVTPRSDQYSLGCVLFEALTGFPPFRGDTSFETMQKRLHEELPVVAEHSAYDVSSGLNDVVCRLLQRDPQDRYDSMREVSDALEQCFEQLSENNRIVTSKALVVQGPKSKREKLIISGIISLGTIFIVIVGLWSEKSDKSKSMPYAPMPERPLVGEINSIAFKKMVADCYRNHEKTIIGPEGRTDESMKVFDGYPYAEDLLLNEPEFTDKTTDYFRKSPVRRMDLSESRVKTLQHIPQFRFLNQLTLTDTEVGDKNLDNLVSLPQLYSLGLKNTKVTDAGLETLAKISRLTILDLDCTKVQSLQHIPEMIYLVKLSLKGNNIDNNSLEQLTKLPMLKSLDLSKNKNITDDAYETMRRMSGVINLELKDTGVSAETIKKLSVDLPNCKFPPQLQTSLLDPTVKSAKKATAAGKFRDALIFYKQCLTTTLNAQGKNCPLASHYLLQIKECLKQLHQRKEATEACLQAIEFARASRSKKAQLDAMDAYASLLAEDGRGRDSMKVRDEAMKLLHDSGNDFLAHQRLRSKYMDCKLFMTKEEKQTTLSELFREASKFYGEDSIQFAQAASNKGLFEMENGNREEALKLAKQSTDILSKQNDVHVDIARDVYFTGAIIFETLGKFEEAVPIAEKAVHYANRAGHSDHIYHASLKLVLLELATRKPEKAKASVNRLIAFISKDEIGTPKNMATAITLLAQAEFALNNFDQSTAEAKKALEIIEASGCERQMPFQVVDTYSLLGHCALSKGDVKGCIDNHKMAKLKAHQYGLKQKEKMEHTYLINLFRQLNRNAEADKMAKEKI